MLEDEIREELKNIVDKTGLTYTAIAAIIDNIEEENKKDYLYELYLKRLDYVGMCFKYYSEEFGMYRYYKVLGVKDLPDNYSNNFYCLMFDEHPAFYKPLNYGPEPTIVVDTATLEEIEIMAIITPEEYITAMKKYIDELLVLEWPRKNKEK